MREDIWAAITTNWKPEGKRKIGRQIKRWSDDIEKVALGRWREKGKDRT